ncbi:3-isopropylmalate dehydrogenase [Flavobacteriaceae bacterium TP-CH-4]|uniref:3-isopropylmalate dehydrogenase n=1 Tax=Pelagihabitans pacificus TaxID=2696054 RepID=A0A967AU68_9FLAO|nr:3-isopropylmalate dehydrogenase [Pelagihabitans pacificus]NHF59260.1 3-isopropylmalate dehydrogenase [Pelagihabitans pacificus]
MQLKIALLGGDGIGPEVLTESVKCLQAVAETFDHSFTYSKALIGAAAMKKFRTPLPDQTLEIALEADALLFGTIGTLQYDNNPSSPIRPEQGLLRLRKELGLYANIRPVKMFPEIIKNSPLDRALVSGTDFEIYRELTGGIYYGEKKLSDDGTVATDICTYSEKEISRIAHKAFKAAKKRRKKLTLVDKANVLETSRLWRRVVKTLSESYPEVTLECLYIDNAAVQLLLNPTHFDIILTDNMFGDMLSDQGSVIIGSQGLLPSASIGEKHCMFEPVHGSYPKAEGKNKANPVASILSTALLLGHFGMKEESRAVIAAVRKSFKKKIVTPDILGSSKYGTDYVGDFIADHINDIDDDMNMNDENIGLGKSTII